MSDTPHILVVDDDREIRTLLRDYLEKNGFKATAVADGQETRRALERTRFDLIVLDLMLPHESGLEICRELRARSEIPIVMLTALGEEVDRIVGLEVGADDYLAKPFSPRELLGRIRAVLRRTLAPRLVAPNDARTYTFAGWKLDMTARSLTTPKGDDRISRRRGVSSARDPACARAACARAHGANGAHARPRSRSVRP